METILENKETNFINQAKRRSEILDGLEQVTQGKTHIFDEVCNRLEKKYRNA